MRRPDGFDRPSKAADEPVVRVSHDDDSTHVEVDADDVAAEPTPAQAAPTRKSAITRAESHAQRTDRLLRAAERRQAAEARAAAKEAARAATSAERAARKAERGEVRRFTAARRRTRRIVLVSLGALVLVFAGLVGLVYSPVMAVGDIRVVGASRTDPEAISSALEPLMGQPIATVTDDAVAARLEPFVGLQSYVVDVVPPGTIIVRVVERQPVLVVASDDADHLVDPAGVDLGEVGDETLPRLTDVEVGSAAFDAIASAVVAMPDDLLEQVTEVTATTSADITMTLADGSTVVWGSPAQSDLKADVLAALVAATDGEAPVTYDVSAPDHPVVR